jgi:hypothetical protein
LIAWKKVSHHAPFQGLRRIGQNKWGTLVSQYTLFRHRMENRSKSDLRWTLSARRSKPLDAYPACFSKGIGTLQFTFSKLI